MNDFNYRKLYKFLKFFINRPNHLAKYLLDHNALKREFLDKISSENDMEQLEKQISSVYFTDIDNMNAFFDSLTNSTDQNTYSNKDLIKELENELKQSIVDERYEDAIRIRDYLKITVDKRKNR